ncbi:GroES-like protein [Lentithecium fluviatile CBS 122367]|uniref:GroES-like protein n=1 Tax=Lentithecium fluviatile CBS 122367 TaxID=1168545 RepID=A0A6G1J6D2_9PLEO|nr:GroES-like protein [Lentithecium fluviatile CBS 122367]
MPPAILAESNKSLTYTQPSTLPHITHSSITGPGPNELLIKVHTTAINPVDLQLWGSSLIGWVAGRKERGIGRDYAGEVVGVGEALRQKWQESDRVFGLYTQPVHSLLARWMGNGTLTQYLTVPPYPLIALTALACLNWLPSESDQDSKRRVIVSGASGGVGTWCVQLAKKVYHCHVIGVCSGRNAKLVKDLGVDEIVDYNQEDVVRALSYKGPYGEKFGLSLIAWVVLRCSTTGQVLSTVASDILD